MGKVHAWCYGSHPYLWHPLGQLTSEAGVQQGDPLGPLFFALVLHKVIDAIDADDDCLHLILQAWYLDDGVLAGPRQAVLRTLSIIEDLGPPMGIFINLSKCELFSRSDISMFPPVMKASHVPHLDILGTPIGDYLFCTGFFAAKRAELTKLLSMLEDVSDIDPQVAFNLLRLCSGFCKMVHLARSTPPPSMAADSLKILDLDLRSCFSKCLSLDLTEAAWCQSQLSLRLGGFGLRSLSHHSSAAFIASFCSSGFATADNHHLIHAVNTFNSLVSTSDAISPESAIESPPSQRSLSHKLDSLTHSSLYDSASPANKARLLSASASLATSWVSVLPSGEPGLHLDPREFRTAISWWLGLETTTASCCLLCPEIALDPLGHHALSCRRGGDVVLRHNQLRDVFVDICHKANLGVRIEAGSALTPDLSRSRPADALVNNWIGGSSAAFDVTVTSPLTPVSLQESSVTAGTAALLAEQRKHQVNDPKCDTLGWKCIPLAVESYGNRGFEARQAFSHLASRLSFGIGHQKSKLLVDIYGRLNVTLVRCNARALLSRACSLF